MNCSEVSGCGQPKRRNDCNAKKAVREEHIKAVAACRHDSFMLISACPTGKAVDSKETLSGKANQVKDDVVSK